MSQPKYIVRIYYISYNAYNTMFLLLPASIDKLEIFLDNTTH